METCEAQKRVNLKCAAMQGFTLIFSCGISGFAAAYLLHKGFTNAQVGAVTGGGYLLGLLMQLLLLALMKRRPDLETKTVTLLLNLTIGALFLLLVPDFLPAAGVLLCYLILSAAVSSMYPFVNSYVMECANRGYPVDFGVTRSVGSLTYAGTSFLLGLLFEKYSPDILPYVCIGAAVLMTLLLCHMRALPVPVASAQKSSLMRLFSENDGFLAAVVGFSLIAVSNSIVITYLVNIVYGAGGSDADFGVCLSLQAVVELPLMFGFRWIIPKFRKNSYRLLQICAAFFLLKFLLLTCAKTVSMVMLGVGMNLVCGGLYPPAIVYFVNEAFDETKRVQAQTLCNIFTLNIACCIGAFLGGVLQDAFGLRVTLWFSVITGAMGFFILFIKRFSSVTRQM